MIHLPPAVHLFVAIDPIDLHLSFDRLAALVRQRLGHDPLRGDLFFFFNRARTAYKALLFDHSGYLILYKRLEAGVFQVPDAPPGATAVQVDPLLLHALLDGIDLRTVQRRRRWSPIPPAPPAAPALA